MKVAAYSRYDPGLSVARVVARSSREAPAPPVSFCSSDPLTGPRACDCMAASRPFIFRRPIKEKGG